MRATILFSAVIALVLASATNAAPTTEAVERDDADAFASLDIRGWDSGVAEAREVVETRGIEATRARLILLTTRKSDLELQLTRTTQTRQQFSSMASALSQRLRQLRPGSAAARQLLAQVRQAQQEAERLDQVARQVNAQLSTVKKQIREVETAVTGNIGKRFDFLGRQGTHDDA